jgi:hypothetical protein
VKRWNLLTRVQRDERRQDREARERQWEAREVAEFDCGESGTLAGPMQITPQPQPGYTDPGSDGNANL